MTKDFIKICAHEYTYNGETPFKWKICDKGFSQYRRLTNHEHEKSQSNVNFVTKHVLKMEA